MDVREITPYLTFFGPLAAVIAAFDYILTDSQKERLFGRLVSVANIAYYPCTFAFYGLTTIFSVAATSAIIVIGGLAQQSEGAGILSMLKSSFPLLLAMIFKILTLDYMLALKSLSVAKSFSTNSGLRENLTGKSRHMMRLLAAFVILIDLIITGFITGVVINWWEIVQASNLPTEMPKAMRPAADFFDEFNSLATGTIQNSFYALNGSLLAYAMLGVAQLANGMSTRLNITEMKKNVCKIIATFLVFIVFVVAIARGVTS
jgi:hypothetical protein